MGPSGSEENFPTFTHFNTLSHMLSASSSDYIGEEMQILLLVQPHLRNNKQFRQMIEYMHSVWSRSLRGWGNRSECVLVKTKTTQYFLIVWTSLFSEEIHLGIQYQNHWRKTHKLLFSQGSILEPASTDRTSCFHNPARQHAIPDN